MIGNQNRGTTGPLRLDSAGSVCEDHYFCSGFSGRSNRMNYCSDAVVFVEMGPGSNHQSKLAVGQFYGSDVSNVPCKSGL